MLKRLENYALRYNEINEELMKPEICMDIKKMTALSKEQRSIAKIVECYTEYKRCLESIEDLKEMRKDPDPELAEMAEMEICNCEPPQTIFDTVVEILTEDFVE